MATATITCSQQQWRRIRGCPRRSAMANTTITCAQLYGPNRSRWCSVCRENAAAIAAQRTAAATPPNPRRIRQ